MLDSSESWYVDFSESRRMSILDEIRKWNKSFTKVYMFPYHIKNIGVAKDLDEDVVFIISRESSY